MRNLANKTKGRFYNVTNPKALPRIYQKEARSISRPLIFEQATPWLPKLNYPLTEPVMRLSEAAAADHRAGADLAQGERAGRDPDRLAAADRPGQPGAGPLDLRPGPLGRVHLRRRPALGEDLARLAKLRRLLVAGDPLVDAAGRPRQPDARTSAASKGGSRSSSTRSTRTTSSSTSSRSRATWSTPT